MPHLLESADAMRHWLDMDEQKLAAFFKEHNQPEFRSRQFRDWLHNKRVSTFDAMSNLPAALRATLSEAGSLRALHVLEHRAAADNLTGKWLFAPEGEERPEHLFESVLIIEKQETRRTVCVSCMIGCPLACTFCATGKLGFTRNLSAGEMLEQIYRLDAWSRSGDSSRGVSHVVFMGMGEPLLNLDNVIRTADALAHPKGMNLSGRHITISTAGVAEGILELAALNRNYRLAVSLHAPNQTLREQIMPAARRWRFPELLSALEKFAQTTSRAITFEYCLLKGVNDSPAQARELAGVVRGLDGKVNLIPWNGVAETGLAAPAAKTVRAFQEALESRGVSAPVRMEKGAEIGAACGQLRAERQRRDG